MAIFNCYVSSPEAIYFLYFFSVTWNIVELKEIAIWEQHLDVLFWCWLWWWSLGIFWCYHEHESECNAHFDDFFRVCGGPLRRNELVEPSGGIDQIRLRSIRARQPMRQLVGSHRSRYFAEQGKSFHSFTFLGQTTTRILPMWSFWGIQANSWLSRHACSGTAAESSIVWSSCAIYNA